MKNKLMILTMALVALSNVMNATEASLFTYNSKNGLFNYKNPKSGNIHPVNERYVAKYLRPEIINYLKGNVQRTTAVEINKAVKVLAQKNKVAQNLSKVAVNFLESQDRFAQTVKNNAKIAFHAAALDSFENEGGKILGSQVIGNASITPFALKVAKAAQSAKVGAVIAAPSMVLGTAYAAGTYALDRAQAQAIELNRRAEKLAKAKMIGAQLAEEKANIQAGLSLQTTRMQRVKNALTNASSVVKTQAMNAGSFVKSHPRIATGTGVVMLAGLSYAAYNKFGKAVKKTTVTVSTPVVKTEAKKETVTPVATPVKKAKKANKPLKGGYARRN